MNCLELNNMANKKLQVVIVDCTTGEEIIRDANLEEIAQAKLDIDNFNAQQAEVKAKKTAKAEILDRIGLTADELKTILG
jgi:hypothetical protein